jgi:site-specific DNA-methyltransferase (adenine-specific)/modification methylase
MYQDNIQLYKGDCLEIMKGIPDKSIDMILCDLPYGTTKNKWDSVIPLDELWKEYKRIIKDNGVIVLTSQGIFTAKLILSNEKWFKYKLVWEKSKATNFLNAKKQPLRKHEDICVFYNKQPQYNPQMTEGKPYDKGVRKNQLTGSYGDFNPVHVKSEGMRYPTDVVYFKTAESEGKVYHPTQKPVALLEYLIKTYTRENELILDNCMGSGSTGVACLNTNRKFIGIEKDDNYFEIAKKRIEEVRYDVSR